MNVWISSALGLVLHEMLTGGLPSVGTPAGASMIRHIHQDPPSPRELYPEISEALEAVVLCALVRDRNARHGQVMTFINDLRWVPRAAGGGRRQRGVPESREAITMQRELHPDVVGSPVSQAGTSVSGTGQTGGTVRISGAPTAPR